MAIGYGSLLWCNVGITSAGAKAFHLHNNNIKISELQKIVLLGTSRILRKTLSIKWINFYLILALGPRNGLGYCVVNGHKVIGVNNNSNNINNFIFKPNATCQIVSTGDEIIDNQIPDALKNAITNRLQQEVMDQKWQRKIAAARWEDQDLSLKECYTWLKGWKAAPTHTIAGIEELQEQLLSTKIYRQKKTGFNITDDMMCRMCGKKPECLVHVLDGCSVLAQTKYLSRHNAALKIPFFEMLKDMELIESNPPWYSPVQPNLVYQNEKAEAYCVC